LDNSWQSLLSRAKSRDASALGELLEPYRNYLLMLARLKVGRRLQGKLGDSDLVQQTYLEAHRDFRQFRGRTEAELVGWLRRLMATNLANQARSFVGTQCRSIHLETDLLAELNRSSQVLDRALFSPSDSPSAKAARGEELVVLADALQRLPEDYREVILGRHFENESFPAIAARMGRSEDSVQKLWARGLSKLRKLLEAPDSSQ
jgi:RNA polymerase sigma-70 factor (ECF subfamily)